MIKLFNFTTKTKMLNAKICSIITEVVKIIFYYWGIILFFYLHILNFVQFYITFARIVQQYNIILYQDMRANLVNYRKI